MTGNLKLPVGIDSFPKIRTEGFYYVDKTKMIEQLLNQWGEVNLFTRPRRFGKTLNMSMLRSFFEIGTDKTLFDGLYISSKKELCEKYMGQFPVIFLSLKNVEGLTYQDAKQRFMYLVAKEAKCFSFLLESPKLTDDEKRQYIVLTGWEDGRYCLEEGKMVSSLQVLSELLYKHFEKKVILLIDEYDVPLDKAFQNGYYREMVALIRGMFGTALKTNEFLYFAVLTGCLRVSKESIFTGLNNFKVLSITDTRFDEHFGFNDREVAELLAAYQLENHLIETKEWYDGYRFGKTDVYCPWDVINHVDRLRSDPEAEPQTYWINTSGNSLVKRFIDKAGKTTRDEIERLIEGEAIEKQVRLELTYDEIDQSIDNLWSVLFTTGYLTQAGITEQGAYRLIIPNKEVREVYKLQIQEWFKRSIMSDTQGLEQFWQAFKTGNVAEVEQYLKRILSNSVSFYDTGAGTGERENAYHTLLIGLLAGNANWLVRSNVEAGDGRADIIVETEDPDAGIIIELKYSDTFAGMKSASEKAQTQIKDRRYWEYLTNDDRNDILLYGIAFCRKKCFVMAEKMNF